MKKLGSLLPLSAFVFILSFLTSHTDGPLHNSALLRVTGAPGENTCYFCHVSNMDNTGPGSITATFSGGSGYVANGNYTITVTITNSAIPKYGFQMSSLRNSNNTRAGTFTPIADTDTFLVAGRHYIEHSTGSTTGTWVIPWQAPSANVGDITFYATGVAAMFPTGTPGDFPYSTSVTITPLQLPVAGFTSVGSVCQGGSIQFTNTSAHATSYQWTLQGGSPPNSIAQDPLVQYSTAGTFDVTLIASNAIGADTTTEQVTIHSLPNATINNPGVLCANGAIIQLTAATNGGTWTGPGTNFSGSFDPAVAGPGSHKINYSVTDGNGCVGFDSINVMVADSVTVSLSSINALCYQDSSGLVEIDSVAGGTPPYSYSWSTPSGPSGPWYIAGFYEVTVTDNNGCTATASVTMTEPPPLDTASTVVVNATTQLSSDGSINITPAGGTPPYAFSWSNAATTEDIDSLAANTYTVMITDSNNCVASFEIVVAADATGVGDLQKEIISISPNPSSGVVSIEGIDYDELFIADQSGRVVWYSATKQQVDVSHLPRGTYVLTVVTKDIKASKRLLISR